MGQNSFWKSAFLSTFVELTFDLLWNVNARLETVLNSVWWSLKGFHRRALYHYASSVNLQFHPVMRWESASQSRFDTHWVLASISFKSSPRDDPIPLIVGHPGETLLTRLFSAPLMKLWEEIDRSAAAASLTQLLSPRSGRFFRRPKTKVSHAMKWPLY